MEPTLAGLGNRQGQVAGAFPRADTLLHATPELSVRSASLDEVDEVLDLLSAAAEWMTARGYTNWPARFSPRLISRSASNGDLYLAEADGVVIATITLQWTDETFWGNAEPDAGYVHRVAVRRSHAGRGIGHQLLDWASEQVRARGRDWLRLDVISDNAPLRTYYEAAGFVHCRDLEGAYTRPDGTLWEWRTSLYQRPVV